MVKMLNNKKGTGSVEFKVILFGLIFMTILNITLGLIVDPSMIQDYDQQEQADELVSELGPVGGFFANSLLSIGVTVYGIFGVDFIAVVTVLPTFVLVLINLLNTVVVFSLIFYLVDRLWLG